MKWKKICEHHLPDMELIHKKYMQLIEQWGIHSVSVEVAVVADRTETIITNIYSTSSECWQNQFYHYVTHLHHNPVGAGDTAVIIL